MNTNVAILPDKLTVTAIHVKDTKFAISKLKDLDLEPIQFKMMDSEEGEGWSLEKVQKIAIEYKRFLMLKILYPDNTISPTRDIDKMWHYHILDTSKYMVDCNEMFGVYLHHFPYFGMRGESDKADLEKCFAQTKELYRTHFGEDMGIEGDEVATSTCSTYCGGNIEILANISRPKLAKQHSVHLEANVHLFFITHIKSYL